MTTLHDSTRGLAFESQLYLHLVDEMCLCIFRRVERESLLLIQLALFKNILQEQGVLLQRLLYADTTKRAAVCSLFCISWPHRFNDGPLFIRHCGCAEVRRWGAAQVWETSHWGFTETRLNRSLCELMNTCLMSEGGTAHRALHCDTILSLLTLARSLEMSKMLSRSRNAAKYMLYTNVSKPFLFCVLT